MASAMTSYQAVLGRRLGLPRLRCDKPALLLSPLVVSRQEYFVRWVIPGGILFFERRFPRGEQEDESGSSQKMMDRFGGLEFPATQCEIKY